MRKIIIATRRSPLALWQAEHVATLLNAQGIESELLPMVTEGDRILDRPLNEIGGKGLFVKGLEQAMLDGQADLAVHSMKDVPADFPEGLGLSVILEREEPRDAFVSQTKMVDLKAGAIIGTSSLRRKTQLLAWRPDLDVRDLRGNVGTRLGKLEAGEYDGIILAAAGLKRLGHHALLHDLISIDQSLPAVGQGAIGIECRSDDQELLAALAPLNHEPTAQAVRAERALAAALGASCQMPLAGFARHIDGQLQLTAVLGSADGSTLLREEVRAEPDESESLGQEAAQRLRLAGADKILAAFH